MSIQEKVLNIRGEEINYFFISTVMEDCHKWNCNKWFFEVRFWVPSWWSCQCYVDYCEEYKDFFILSLPTITIRFYKWKHS